MTDARREDYWDGLSTDGGDEADDVETETVRERIEEQLGQLHGLAVTRKQDETVYCVVSQSTTWSDVDDSVEMDIPVLDIRTVVVDLGAESVKVSDNGLWVPREEDVSQDLAQLLARTTTDLRDGVESLDREPALKTSVEGVEPEMLLDHEMEVAEEVEGQYVDKMESHTGIDPSRPWGYGAGPPPEVSDVVERLEEAGLDPEDHLSRLVFGKKEPMDRVTRPVDELKGNYGIELLPRSSGLISIDVDYPEHFPDSELPETMEVSSPHGDDSRRHIILRCDDKETIAEELGAWAVQSVDWGDLWIGDRYVVGPGSQLSEFGCDYGPHKRGDRGGCEACEDPESGFYQVINDAPIASVDPEDILGLLDDSDEWEPRNGRADPDPPESEDVDDEQEGVTCDNCGATHDDEEQLKELPVGEDTRRICRGGCDA